MSRFSPANMYWPHGGGAVHFDWANAWDGEEQEPRYTFWEAFGESNQLVFDSGSGAVMQFSKSEPTREMTYQPYEDGSYEGELPEGPMMSFYWPLGTSLPLDDPARTASAMRGLSVCLVQVDEVYGVALTGGGMDLSWVLAAAAVSAGFLPWQELSLDNWDYGCATAGETWAKRIRVAVKYRLQAERRNAARKLADIDRNWR
jgi:hypothetical protein